MIEGEPKQVQAVEDCAKVVHMMFEGVGEYDEIVDVSTLARMGGLSLYSPSAFGRVGSS